MTLVGIGTGLIVVALLASVVLSWAADLRRVGRAVSAREAWRGAPMSGHQARVREMRERIARERARREHMRPSPPPNAAGGPAPPYGQASGHSAGTRVPTPAEAAEARHRATLELAPGPVTADALRASYRRLVVAYHPDRTAGLGRKLQRLAEEETKSINEAYAFFKRRLADAG